MFKVRWLFGASLSASQDGISRLRKTEWGKGTEALTFHGGQCNPLTSELLNVIMSQQLQTSTKPTVSRNGEFMVNLQLRGPLRPGYGL